MQDIRDDDTGRGPAGFYRALDEMTRASGHYMPGPDDAKAERAERMRLARNARCAQRERDWCFAKRRELLTRLGMKCAHCGETWETKLEFDHIAPRTWVAAKLSQRVRLMRYEEEIRAGLIQLLCGDCNKRKAKPGRARPRRRAS